MQQNKNTDDQFYNCKNVVMGKHKQDALSKKYKLSLCGTTKESICLCYTETLRSTFKWMIKSQLCLFISVYQTVNGFHSSVAICQNIKTHTTFLKLKNYDGVLGQH